MLIGIKKEEEEKSMMGDLLCKRKKIPAEIGTGLCWELGRNKHCQPAGTCLG